MEAEAQLPGYGGVTGWAALHWRGARWFEGLGEDGRSQRDVTLATGGITMRPRPGVVASEEGLGPHELLVHDGLALTSAIRSVCFEARYAATLWRAVSCLDMAAFNDIVALCECCAYLTPGLNAWTGVPQARAAVLLADENSWSPRETLMRHVWTIGAGRPRPLCNPPVFDQHGRFIGTPDLLDPEAGVVGEYDGALHLTGAQRSRDVLREAAFRGVGLEYVTMLAGDARDPRHFIGRLHAAYPRASCGPVGPRQWTLEKPPWWVPTETVAQRRALTDEQRRRLLAIRAG